MTTLSNIKQISNEMFSINAAFAFEKLIRKTFIKHRNIYGSLNLCIENYLDKEVRIALVDVLNTCICCHRHQLDRPVKYEPWIETANSHNQLTDCECRCRHFSRFICRTCE